MEAQNESEMKEVTAFNGTSVPVWELLYQTQLQCLSGELSYQIPSDKPTAFITAPQIKQTNQLKNPLWMKPLENWLQGLQRLSWFHR